MTEVVEVGGGRLRGVREEGIWRFAGIPYAAPPVGDRRWRLPLPPEPWSGVRDARGFGPMAPQTAPRGGLRFPEEPDEQSEDCLTLNLWTPGLDDRRRPVMVWIHGGSFLSGSGASFLFRGAELADIGDVVVVTLNYRVGALGFLGHPALSDAGSGPRGRTGAPLVGNWGLHDQVAALRWVHSHISAFGGDPSSVTLFGESAGAMSISALLGAPEARRLFHRAILQSGPPYTHSPARARKAAENLAGVLGIARIDRPTLQAVPAADLVGAAQELADRRPSPGELPLPFLPVVDGVFLPTSPEVAIGRGDARDIAVMAGTTRDEMTLFTMNSGDWDRLEEANLRQRLAALVPEIPTDRLIYAYRTARSRRGEATDPVAIWNAIGTDLVFRWPTLRLADAQRQHQRRTFVYLFTWTTPFMGGRLGSCHGIDLPFVFGAVRFPAVAAFAGGGTSAEELAERVERSWSAFARHGDPSRDPLGHWPAWDVQRRPTMLLGPDATPRDAPFDEELAVWRDRPDAWSTATDAPTHISATGLG